MLRVLGPKLQPMRLPHASRAVHNDIRCDVSDREPVLFLSPTSLHTRYREMANVVPKHVVCSHPFLSFCQALRATSAGYMLRFRKGHNGSCSAQVPRWGLCLSTPLTKSHEDHTRKLIIAEIHVNPQLID